MNNTFKNLLALLAISISIAACNVFEGRESGGQYVDDASITSKVKTRLFNDEIIRGSAMDIHVETLHGVVQLSGFTTSERKKIRAENIAEMVPGVRSVKDDIVIR